MTTRPIETWLPIAEIGVEGLRERTPMTPFPAPNRLHVWWARRPLVASRAAILAALLPADADQERFIHVLGIHGFCEASHKLWKHNWDRASTSSPPGAPAPPMSRRRKTAFSASGPREGGQFSYFSIWPYGVSREKQERHLMAPWHGLFGSTVLSERFLREKPLLDAEQAQLDKLAETWLERPTSVSWFMRCLNEHIVRNDKE